MGYNNAKRNGMVKMLGAGATFEFDVELGITGFEKTKEIKQIIENILGEL